MHGYQIRILFEIMYSIHKLILKRDWDALAEFVQLECDIEEIIYELNDYPGEISECTRDDFFDSIRLNDFDGYTIDSMAQLFFDGEESDLSMECSFTFNGKELRKAVLHRVHVF